MSHVSPSFPWIDPWLAFDFVLSITNHHATIFVCLRHFLCSATRPHTNTHQLHLSPMLPPAFCNLLTHLIPCTCVCYSMHSMYGLKLTNSIFNLSTVPTWIVVTVSYELKREFNATDSMLLFIMVYVEKLKKNTSHKSWRLITSFFLDYCCCVGQFGNIVKFGFWNRNTILRFLNRGYSYWIFNMSSVSSAHIAAEFYHGFVDSQLVSRRLRHLIFFLHYFDFLRISRNVWEIPENLLMTFL